MPTMRTACNRDCPDACSILVEVDGEGRAVRLQGDPDDPITRGFLCERTTRFLQRQYAPGRFTTPMVRREGALAPASWDEALDLAAERLLTLRERHGPESILHYRSGGSLGMLKVLADALFHRFGPVSAHRGDICGGAGTAAQELDFGICDSHDPSDLRHSRLILLWGKNVHTSSVHLLPLLHEARSRGCVLVGVDVVRTRTMDLCDIFIPVRPGGDFALAMGVAHRLFERGQAPEDLEDWADQAESYRCLAEARSVKTWAREAGVEIEQIDTLADLYGSVRPAAMLVGWGLGRRRHGGTTVRALDALAALTGNLGIPGGGVSFYHRRRAAFDLSFAQGKPSRTFAEARLGPELVAAEPPVRMIWVTAGNPVSMLPDSAAVRQGFQRAEFVVVVDTHPTDTTDLADLVLPTLTLLEDDDLLGAYGNHFLRVSSPAVAPPGEARHELEILQGLARRLGLAEVVAGTPEEWKRRLLRPVESDGVTLDRLALGPVRNPRAPHVLFEGRRFPTRTGRMELLEEAPPSPPPRPEGFPLTLLAISTPRSQSSQQAGPVEPGLPPARVHPAAARGIGHGEAAWLESANGRLQVRVLHEPRVHPEAVWMDKGGMLRDDRCANALVQARETDLGGGAAYYDEPVRLVKA